jgi:hypothetical protein
MKQGIRVGVRIEVATSGLRDHDVGDEQHRADARLRGSLLKTERR